MSETTASLSPMVVQQLLVQHRKNLNHLLLQEARYGAGMEPLALHNQIELERDRIALLEQQSGIVLAAPIIDIAGPAIARGLTALTGLLRHPEVYAAVETYADQFAAMRHQIVRLKRHKAIHDLLHQLQFHCYDLIVQERRRLTSPDAWDFLGDHLFTLRGIVLELGTLRDDHMATASLVWIDDVAGAADTLQDAIERVDNDVLYKAIWRLRRVLDLQPSYINAELNSTARALGQTELGPTMRRLLQRLQQLELSPQHLRLFANSVDALAGLGSQLMQLVASHDAWQLIDRELRRIEAVLEHDMVDLALSWPDLHQRVEVLCADNEAWVATLRACADRLGEAISANDDARIVPSFRKYRRAICQQFYRVDLAIKQLCQSLDEFRDPLSDMQRVDL